MEPSGTSSLELNTPSLAKPPSQVRTPRPLVSDSLRNAGWVWLSHFAPIILLLIWGLHTYSIVEGELNSSQRGQSLAEAGGLVAFALITSAIALHGQKTKSLLSNAKCWVLLIISAGVMGLGFLFSWCTIPWSIPSWIADQNELLYEAFCLGMVGTFYAVLLLASAPLRRHGGIEFLTVSAITALVLGAAYLFFVTSGHFLWELPQWVWSTAVAVAVFGGGAAITGLIVRLTLIAYTGIRRLRPIFQQVFMFVVAVAGPIAGLWLNIKFPFPVDFQAPIIYVLSLVNGALLMLPVVRSLFWHRAIWLAQCVMFPFSAYFLMVFLPWMPLSVFAMIIAGSGFLMLVPLVLGVVHGFRIVDGYQEEVRDGPSWRAAAMGIAAVLVLPVAGLWSIWQDRATLDNALNYLYAPDYRKDITFHGDLSRLDSGLQHLRNAKNGIFLPFLTPLYNEIVFHGLVLPNEKIDALQAAFLGNTVEKQANLMLRAPTDREWWGGGTTPPPRDATLQDVKITEHRDGATGTARLRITVNNAQDVDNEYVGTIHLPEGIFVTGFGLYINKELVPARIVEKKTALWVYEKITQQRRDPGLLIYKSRTDLELHIFPVPRRDTREVELELTYSNAAPVAITIGDKTLSLGVDVIPTGTTYVSSCATDSGSMAIADGANTGAFQLERMPYLDILIDCSKEASYTTTSLNDAIDQARKAFPEATMARVSAINFEARDIVPDLVPVGQLNAESIRASLLQSRGGLLKDRFLKRGLLLASDFMQAGTDHALLRPQFIIISSQGTEGQKEDRMEDFLRLAPDARVIYAQAPSGSFQGQDMVTRHAAEKTSSPVALWNWNSHYAVSPTGSRLAASFSGNAGQGSPQLYDAQKKEFVSAATSIVIPTISRFADGVRTWAAQDEAALDPSLLRSGATALIGLSKKTGVLIPDSSYIAVESPSQWRILEEKEKAKLKNKQVFELEEPAAAPEPGTWALLTIGLVLLAFWRRQRAR